MLDWRHSIFVIPAFFICLGCHQLPLSVNRIKQHETPLYLFRADNGKWGYFSLAGRIVIPPIFEGASPFSEDLASVRLRTANGMRWGYIGRNGHLCIEPVFVTAGRFSSGLAAVRIDKSGKYGFIDRSGKFLIEPRFTEVSAFSGRICEVMSDGNKVLINRDGSTVLQNSPC